jgi:ornithine cyclodeaminase/alanine dehydrogenase-like protein (mu-crystallin family)
MDAATSPPVSTLNAASHRRPTLVLTRSQVRGLLSPADYLSAIELGFRAEIDGKANAPPPLHLKVEGGGLHAKGASIEASARYAAVKVNSNFPGNPAARGWPTIQGALLLFDAAHGSLLAVLDSIEITLRRTAAATALAARHLARRSSRVVTICGCGEQAGPQLAALNDVLPVRSGFVWDLHAEKACAFAAETSEKLHIALEPIPELKLGTLKSDLIVTCTTAKSPFLGIDDVRAGTFVAAVGADSPDKSEIGPDLMTRSKVVVDTLEQCLVMGDLHHAIRAKTMVVSDVHATLGEVVAGKRLGRSSDDEITIFDSTGTAIEDVSTAAMIYERAVTHGVGTQVFLNT